MTRLRTSAAGRRSDSGVITRMHHSVRRKAGKGDEQVEEGKNDVSREENNNSVGGLPDCHNYAGRCGNASKAVASGTETDTSDRRSSGVRTRKAPKNDRQSSVEVEDHDGGDGHAQRKNTHGGKSNADQFESAATWLGWPAPRGVLVTRGVCCVLAVLLVEPPTTAAV
eukprot:CAMPEP_0174844068 /NCGR_PEP_ID=MMETSP1114-20130205/10888_1 /TAXON_ID=312471 /ORGANISM="Neobodo designis, Strain CCAP 1951/1" /LENGTH=167 /DNA_ID=CAMNT_0016078301 /DNA_START=274 /DNA_END=774 /DNA_ORIENTATION=-